MKSITRFTKNFHGNKCLNCQKDISLEDNFCPRCGQVNDTHRLSVKQYFSVYFEGFFNFDNRFLRTVVPLLLKPGDVSKKYVNGRRIYYVNPFQLYLHITILFFLLVGVFKTIDSYKPGEQGVSNIISELSPEEQAQVLDSIKEGALAEIQKPEHGMDSVTLAAINQGIGQVTQLNKPRENPEMAPDKKEAIRSYVDSIFTDSTKYEVFMDTSKSTKEKDSAAGVIMRIVEKKTFELADLDTDMVVTDWKQVSTGWENYSERNELNREAAYYIEELLEARGTAYTMPDNVINPNEYDLPENALGRLIKKIKVFMAYDKRNPDSNVLSALKDMGFEATYTNVFYYNKARDWNDALSDSEYWKEWVDRVLSRVSVALFFLLPIFTMIVSLLYWRHHYNYTENLVFVFHVQTVFFLLLMIFMIVGRISDSDWVSGIFISLFLFYLYKAMRHFYQQGRFKTLVKFFILNSSFVFLAIIGAVIVSFLAFVL